MKAEANVFFCSILSPAPNTVPDRDYVLSFAKGRTEGKRVERKDGKKREERRKDEGRSVSSLWLPICTWKIGLGCECHILRQKQTRIFLEDRNQKSRGRPSWESDYHHFL